jgi:hypothetical protein
MENDTAWACYEFRRTLEEPINVPQNIPTPAQGIVEESFHARTDDGQGAPSTDLRPYAYLQSGLQQSFPNAGLAGSDQQHAPVQPYRPYGLQQPTPYSKPVAYFPHASMASQLPQAPFQHPPMGYYLSGDQPGVNQPGMGQFGVNQPGVDELLHPSMQPCLDYPSVVWNQAMIPTCQQPLPWTSAGEPASSQLMKKDLEGVSTLTFHFNE